MMENIQKSLKSKYSGKINELERKSIIEKFCEKKECNCEG